jgi:hypothetical protein
MSDNEKATIFIFDEQQKIIEIQSHPPLRIIIPKTRSANQTPLSEQSLRMESNIAAPDCALLVGFPANCS